MSICVKLRGGSHVMLKEDFKLPPESVKDINDYHAECRLRDTLFSAGFRAEYSLDPKSYPLSIEIVIPPGKDKAYPGQEEHLILRPQIRSDGTAILTVEHRLSSPKHE